ncbi:hypothetical protein H9X78_11730 [Clostridium saudiense]|nr:hypothetical protein [Clostridium saudiense]
MKVKEIVEFLNDNELGDVEVLKSEKDLLLVNFYYDFDEDLLAAAKAYANEECEDETSDSWEKEYYLPYLYDFCNDEVLSIVEEITEELNVAGEFMAFQMKDKTAEYVQFMVLFTNEDSDISIEDVVRDYIG